MSPFYRPTRQCIEPKLRASVLSLPGNSDAGFAAGARIRLRFALALKVYVLSAYPILSYGYDELVMPNVMPAWTHSQTREIAAPFMTGYVFSFIILLALGLAEQTQKRRKQAIWNFLFTFVALVCQWQLSGMTQKLK